tara:strand:+ start:310 stop:579 length:270 start_codon:yes stop_codon:yes gene_type:complete
MNRRQVINRAVNNSLKDSNLRSCVTKKDSNLRSCVTKITKQDRIKKFLGNELNKLGNVSYAQQRITHTLENMKTTPNNKVYFMRRNNNV